MCGLKGQSLVGSDPIALKPMGELPWGNMWSQEDPGDQNPTDVAVGQRKGGRAMSSLWPRMLDQGELHGGGEAKERDGVASHPGHSTFFPNEVGSSEREKKILPLVFGLG